MGAVTLTRFEVHVDDAVLDDLRARIRATRWPPREPVGGWRLGTDGDYLRALAAYWADKFDWRAAEAELNARPQFQAGIGGARIHFIHQRARRAGRPALILS